MNGPRPLTLILAPIDQGTRNVGGRPGAAQAPSWLLEALEARDLLPAGTEVVEPEIGNEQGALEEDLTALDQAVNAVLASDRFPLVLGGDHGTTYATVRGARRALGRVSVTYLDVHFDMRPFQPVHTSGSSFRRLIDEGVVDPEHVHPLGIQRPGSSTGLKRSGYLELEAWADEHGVPWSSIEHVRGQGVGPTVRSCLAGAPAPCVSFDVDCLDQAWAPGVSAPGPDRFTLEEVLEAVEAAASRCRVFDVVEYAPPLDEQGRTLESVLAVLERFLHARSRG